MNMRGRLTEQKLTDYALNELPPDQRRYAETVLAVSEECRNDVYEMADLAEMLKEGFEAEADAQKLELNAEQRAKLLDVPGWHWGGLLQKVAAVLLLSVGTAFLVSRPGFRETSEASVERLASAGPVVHRVVTGLQEKGLARTAEEFRDRLEAAAATPLSVAEWQFAAQPAVCTPPAWVDSPLPKIVEM